MAFVSLTYGAIAPFMIIAICRAFDVFAELPLSNTAALVLSNITSSLWLAMGEGDLWVLCCHAYHVIKEMVWFDKMDPLSLQTYSRIGRHRCRLCMTKENRRVLKELRVVVTGQ